MTLNSAALKALAPSMPGWIEVLLILVLSWMLAGLVVKPMLPSSGNLQPLQPEEESYSVNVQELIAAAPFGKAAVPKPSKAAVKSRLAIKLLGTILAGEQSAALVKAKQGSAEEVFYIGEAISPGVLLREIEASQIVIEVSGRREIIMLDASAPINTGLLQKKRRQGKLKKISAQVPVQRLRLSRSVLGKEMQNMAKLMTQARLTPYFEKGKANGFQISEIVPGSIYQRIGLRNGDIIGNVNGLSPSRMDQVASIIQTLKESQSLEILVQRNKRSLKLQYEIR
ncbi:MAG: type II secretion system protein N [Mariprofundaceae bacterium]